MIWEEDWDVDWPWPAVTGPVFDWSLHVATRRELEPAPSALSEAIEIAERLRK